MADDLLRRYRQRFADELEPERYELVSLLDDLTPDRRAFLRTLGGGMLLLVTVRAQDREVPVRVQLAEDGRVRAFTGKVELGQGARTLLTQAFAEELGVPVAQVTLVMGDTALCPDDGGTWSSLTSPQTVPVVRAAAAAIRTGRSDGTLTSPTAWQTLGRAVPNVAGRAIVTGTKRFPTDVTMPGMLHAAIVRGPHHRSALQSARTDVAEAMSGVRVLRDGDLLAAVASDPRLATRAAATIEARWSGDPVPPEDDWPARFKASAETPTAQPRARYPPLLVKGDVEAALAGAARRLSSRYWVAPIAHVPLEPRAAVADWRDGMMTIHSGPQAPFLVREEVARALGLAADRVRVIAVDPGGAFGGKQRGECEVEAARLARLAGAPVRVAWSREDEFTCGYTRPAGLIEIESGLDDRGRIAALRVATYNSGAAGLAPPYDLPHVWIGFHRTTAFVRQGSYRALAAVANTFARESHIDECAAAAGDDPLAFRLRHIVDTRLREVLTRTARRFGWQAARASQRAVGLSCTIEKDARLALCVELDVSGAEPRVVRMTATGDFGAVLNPAGLRRQVTGALIQGLGGALWERVRFEGTAQVTRRLSDYRVPTFTDVPVLDVEIVDHRELPSAGAGESPITLPAPAIASALHAATGRRHPRLPLLPLRG